MTQPSLSTVMLTHGYSQAGLATCTISREERDVPKSGEGIYFIITMVASSMTKCSPSLCSIVSNVMRTTALEVISSVVENFLDKIHPQLRNYRTSLQRVMTVISKCLGIIPVISKGVIITGGQRHKSLSAGSSIMFPVAAVRQPFLLLSHVQKIGGLICGETWLNWKGMQIILKQR